MVLIPATGNSRSQGSLRTNESAIMVFNPAAMVAETPERSTR